MVTEYYSFLQKVSRLCGWDLSCMHNDVTFQGVAWILSAKNLLITVLNFFSFGWRFTRPYSHSFLYSRVCHLEKFQSKTKIADFSFMNLNPGIHLFNIQAMT